MCIADFGVCRLLANGIFSVTVQTGLRIYCEVRKKTFRL